MKKNSIEIERMRCNYIVPVGEQNAAGIKEKLDNVAGSLLEQECDRVLSHRYSDDSSIIFIRHLRIDFALNAAKLDGRDIAKHWGGRIASTIVNTLANQLDGHNVVRFAGNTDYIAGFLIDLLRGVAWRKWYFQGLEHLKKYDNKRIIKELLSRERDIVEDVLLRIIEGKSLEEFLNNLTEDDAGVIYEDYLDVRQRHVSRSYKELISALSEIINNNPLDFHGDRLPGYKNYMNLYLKAIQKHPDLRSVDRLRRAVKLTILLKEFSRRYEGGAALSNLIEEGGLGRLVGFIKAKGESEFSGLAAMVREVINSEGEGTLLDIVKGVEDGVCKTALKKIFTLYGGLFILIRTIIDTKLHLLVSSAPFPEYEHLPKTRVFFLFLAQKISGLKELNYENIDPGLLLFAGFKNPPVPGILKEYIQSITPEMNRKYLELLMKFFSQKQEDLNEILSTTPGNPEFESVLDITTRLVYGYFAGSLRRFEKSSTEYIFKNFIQRQSEILLEQYTFHIKLSKKSLDLVLRMSGFLEDIQKVPWLDNRSIKFTLGN